MATRSEIVMQARTWLKTPWRHQGRLKGVRVDCAGLIIGVGKECGLIATDGSADRLDYGRQAQPQRMRMALEEHCDHIPKSEIQPGDVLWLRAGKDAQHLGILSERRTLIHATNNPGLVEERPLDSHYQSKIVAVFRYRGIDGGA